MAVAPPPVGVDGAVMGRFVFASGNLGGRKVSSCETWYDACILPLERLEVEVVRLLAPAAVVVKLIVVLLLYRPWPFEVL